MEFHEVACSKCKGTGSTDNYFTCDKCVGEGKLDWVSDIMGPKPRSLSALDRINVRRMVEYVRNEISSIMLKSPAHKVNPIINDFMSNLHLKKLFYEYMVYNDDINNYTILIKPNKAVDVIKIDFEIK